MPRTLVAGATGATGRLLVAQLLERGHEVRGIVRSPDRLPAELREHPQFTPIRGTVLGLSDLELAGHARGCQAVVSCLGHNLTAGGIWGPPHRLVAGSLRRLALAIKASRASVTGSASGSSAAPRVKLLLMCSSGVTNPDAGERVPAAERAVVGLIRALIPPHADNEQAALYLRTGLGQDDPAIAWVALRPDSLIDRPEVTDYTLHPSPTRSAIFDAGKASRINVAHALARLVDDDELFEAWRGQMPVLYDAGSA